jgi:Ni,Fe-hydrogenase maturation factor
MSHHVDPKILVTAAKHLYGKAPEAIVATVTGENFGLGSELSPKVKGAMQQVVAYLRDLISTRLERLR